MQIVHTKIFPIVVIGGKRYACRQTCYGSTQRRSQVSLAGGGLTEFQGGEETSIPIVTINLTQTKKCQGSSLGGGSNLSRGADPPPPPPVATGLVLYAQF